MQRQQIITQIEEMSKAEQVKLVTAGRNNQHDKILLHEEKIRGLEKLREIISRNSSPLIRANERRAAISEAVQLHPRLVEGTFSTIKNYFNQIAPDWDEQKNIAPTNLFSHGMAPAVNTNDFLFKVVLLGDTEVGKSRVFSQASEQQFTDKRTINVDLASKIIGKSKLHIWDTAGKEQHTSILIIENYINIAHAVILMFDVTRKETFNHIEEWHKRILDAKSNALIILVGNKCDLENDRQVATKEAQHYASEKEILYLEISGKDKAAVNQLFETIDVNLRAKHQSELKIKQGSSLGSGQAHH